jgi:hypothetical protein
MAILPAPGRCNCELATEPLHSTLGRERCTACGAVWGRSRSHADQRDVAFVRDQLLARQEFDDDSA